MIRMTLGIALVLATLAADARSAELVLSPRDINPIHDGEGASRILFRLDGVEVSDYRMISEAILEIPFSGSEQERHAELRVLPVTTAWIRGVGWDGGWERDGGDFDEQIPARDRVDLRNGSGVARFDLTVAFREILEEGMFADGFILTEVHPDRAGLVQEDLGRWLLQSASLTVKTRTLPTGRPPFARLQD